MTKIRENKAEDLKEAIESVDLNEGWFQELLDSEPTDLALILADLANSARIPTSTFRNARTGLPSLLGQKWKDFAAQGGAPLMLLQFADTLLPQCKTNVYHLPPSFHEPIAKAMWRAQDAYRETTEQDKDTTRLRILDTYIVPIVGLFQSRIFDRPGQELPATSYSTAAEVEHQITFVGGILFLIVEFYHHIEVNENLARLFLELLAAAERNKKFGYPRLRIHGLLTDMERFIFYSYDPITSDFLLDEIMLVNRPRESQISDMISVANKIFSIIMFEYTNATRVYLQWDEKKTLNVNSELAPETAQPLVERRLARRWDSALLFAEQSCAKFSEPATTVEMMEENSTEALKLLSSSVCSLSRRTLYYGGDEPDDITAMARRLVMDKHKKLLQPMQ